ncbi:MAG: glucose-1-phosphate adenylyltransferase [Clostridium sp.]|jgi:glucose-1-phosphate adenylyltransferase
MDYSKMLDYHKEKCADATIAVFEVPHDEASRFGIMNTTTDNKIYEFEEKPQDPKSNMASMGVYIFNWKFLKNFLKDDENNKHSSNDFGKNIIPAMLKSEKNIYAYPFKGYWKDVGTIKSLWEANMDLIDDNNELNIHDESWRIYSISPSSPAQYIGPNAKVTNSLVVQGCIVLGEVYNSVLFQGVTVGKNSKISNSVIMPNTKISDNVIINKAIIGNNVIIRGHSLIGISDDITLISEGTEIKSNSVIR